MIFHCLKEEEIMDNFQDFLISLGDEVITGYTGAIVCNTGDGADQCTNYDQEIETFSTRLDTSRSTWLAKGTEIRIIVIIIMQTFIQDNLSVLTRRTVIKRVL